MATYTVWSLDVWGNESEGWDVNDRSRVGSVELADDASDADIIHTLIEAGICDPCATTLASIDDQGDGLIDVNERNGKPCYSLERD